MTETNALSWRTLPASFRSLGRWLTIVQVIGYTSSLAYVWQTTRLLPAGIAGHYRGLESAEGAMEFPKSLSEMLTITHTHLLGMAAIFALSGASLALCEGVSERWRTRLIVEPFIALLVSVTSIWLMRYVDPHFAWLLEASSSLMALTFYAQSFLVLRELARSSRG
ncbi:MAG: hypothetical protein ABJD11_19020 [Gemmatimonadota bacterium]